MTSQIKNHPSISTAATPSAVLDLIWYYNPRIAKLLRRSRNDEEARALLYSHLARLERRQETQPEPIHPLEWDITLEAVQMMKNLISERSRNLTGFNFVNLLRRLASPQLAEEALQQVKIDFLMELERLLAGCRSRSGLYRGQRLPKYRRLEGREAALERSRDLDHMAERVLKKINRYATGMDRKIIQLRRRNRERILAQLQADRKAWEDWRWQIRHVIRKPEELEKLVELNREERQAIEISFQNRVPFGITPYYVHLMDPQTGGNRDRAVRRQVIPPLEYAGKMAVSRRKHEKSFDFMLERDTSPEDLITRRYPLIAILKPYNTCAQICVYCQRNWEIEGCLDPRALASPQQLDQALKFIAQHSALREILITGGDPLILSDERLKDILDRLSRIPHVERIRIGTRTPVVLPMRITADLADLIAGYRVPGRRDVCIITHFEHPYEVTPEAAAAVHQFRSRGLAVFNQVVFTFANSRRFELVALRRILGLIGVEPYYTFSPKGKEETNWYRIPIARMLQARKEEARITPGIWRTDDTVFNVPGLGKNYLNRQQDHSVIALLPDGRRVYEFHPWEKKLALADTYLYTDVSIYEYLQRLNAIGEDPKDYSSIWYYY
jgi:lysine 2,3-aminomutase